MSLILLLTIAIGTVSDASAYTVKRRWGQGSNLIEYGVKPGVGPLLNPSFTDANVRARIADAAYQWSISSRFKLEYDVYSTHPEWNVVAFTPTDIAGRVENQATTNSGRQLVLIRPLLQAGVPGSTPGSRTWHYNTLPGGTTYGCVSNVCNWSVFKVSTHEFGHFLQLGDDPGYAFNNESVMYGSSSVGSGIYIDDKQGATMIYGFESGFENAQYLGIGPTNQVIRTTEHANVTAYSGTSTCGGGSTKPHYWTYNGGTDGISSSPAGGRFMRFQGCGSTADTSKTHMTLATYGHDSNGDDPKCGLNWCYLQVQSGMKLRWYQYNATAGQCSFAPGLRFDDGTYLYNHTTSADPAYRTCGAGWRYQEIDLSSVVGKKITEYYLYYNNSGANGVQGSWRFYIDSLNIS